MKLIEEVNPDLANELNRPSRLTKAYTISELLDPNGYIPFPEGSISAGRQACIRLTG